MWLLDKESRVKAVYGSAEWGRLGLIIGPGGPQRLLILCGNPPPKAAGSFVLLPWRCADDRTLCGRSSPGGGPRRGDALAFLPQGALTLRVPTISSLGACVETLGQL